MSRPKITQAQLDAFWETYKAVSDWLWDMCAEDAQAKWFELSRWMPDTTEEFDEIEEELELQQED